MKDHADVQASHERFVRRVVKEEVLWFLRSEEDGLAACPSLDDESRTVVAFWSARAYAKRCAHDMWEGYWPTELNLFDFLFRQLTGMTGDGSLAGTDFDGQFHGLEHEPKELKQELIDAMPDVMFERYRAELQRQFEEQG